MSQHFHTSFPNQLLFVIPLFCGSPSTN